MLEAIGVPSLDALIDETIPAGHPARAPLDLPAGEAEHAYLRRLRGIAAATRRPGRTSASATTTASRRA